MYSHHATRPLVPPHLQKLYMIQDVANYAACQAYNSGYHFNYMIQPFHHNIIYSQEIIFRNSSSTLMVTLPEYVGLDTAKSDFNSLIHNVFFKTSSVFQREEFTNTFKQEVWSESTQILTHSLVIRCHHPITTTDPIDYTTRRPQYSTSTADHFHFARYSTDQNHRDITAGITRPVLYSALPATSSTTHTTSVYNTTPVTPISTLTIPTLTPQSASHETTTSYTSSTPVSTSASISSVTTDVDHTGSSLSAPTFGIAHI